MEKYVFAVIVLVFLGLAYFLFPRKPKGNNLRSLVLFPHWFKPLGIVLALVSFVLVAFLDFTDEEIWKGIATHCINMGLFFVCFSKDKLEDELTNTVRLHAFYTSVISGFAFLVLMHFLDYVMGNDEYIYPARQLITIILAVYAFRYAALKRKVFYGK